MLFLSGKDTFIDNMRLIILYFLFFCIPEERLIQIGKKHALTQ